MFRNILDNHDDVIVEIPDITDKIYKAEAALKEARDCVENILSHSPASNIDNRVILERSGVRLYLLLK